jgi:Tfp pilus assembly protein FimT
MIVMVITLIVAGIAIPKVISMIQEMRASGDARDLNGAILLAKMRAAANFARARVYVNLSTNTFHIEWQQSGTTTWTPEGGDQYLAKGVSFGYGSLTTPPPNTQSTLSQATACDGVANTACIIFNSRGIPITSAGVPTETYALYVTDGKVVTGVTVSATGLTKIWRTEATAANWKQR